MPSHDVSRKRKSWRPRKRPRPCSSAESMNEEFMGMPDNVGLGQEANQECAQMQDNLGLGQEAATTSEIMLPRVVSKDVAELTPLLWCSSNQYQALMHLELETLENAYGLRSKAQALHAAVPPSTYAQRGLIRGGVSKTQRQQLSRELPLAASALRQANMRNHTFSTVAHSIRSLMRRIPKKECERQGRRRELLSRCVRCAMYS